MSKTCNSSKCGEKLTQRENETKTSFGLRSTCNNDCRGQVTADVAERKHQLLVKEKDNCQGCDKQLVQRTNEPNRMFLKRENCGKSCANTKIARLRRARLDNGNSPKGTPFSMLMNMMSANKNAAVRPYN